MHVKVSLEELIETGANPIRVIREGMGLSIRKAAQKIGCHYQALYMCEHGMYRSVLPVVLTWAEQNSDFSRHQIDAAYSKFRETKKQVAREKYSLHLVKIEALGEPGDHPVLRLRESLGLNQSSFCKEFCVPVALLYVAENKAASLPIELRSGLADVGLPSTVLQEMVDRYEMVSYG